MTRLCAGGPQAGRAREAFLSDLDRETTRGWHWSQGCGTRMPPRARLAVSVAIRGRGWTHCPRRATRSRSNKPADDADDAPPDAPAGQDAPAEEDAAAEGAAVDPGVASTAAASRAAAVFAAGDAAAACAAWTEALSWAPGDAALLCRRAEGQLALGRAAESLADARSAAQLRPRLAEPHVRAGIALMALERPDEAAAAFRRALELEPSHEARLTSRSRHVRAAHAFACRRRASS